MSRWPSLSKSATAQFWCGPTMSCFLVKRTPFAGRAGAGEAAVDNNAETVTAPSVLRFTRAPLKFPRLPVRADGQLVGLGVAGDLLPGGVPLEQPPDTIRDVAQPAHGVGIVPVFDVGVG